MGTKKAFKMKIKSIFHQFQRAFNEVKTQIFLEGESPTLKLDAATER